MLGKTVLLAASWRIVIGRLVDFFSFSVFTMLEIHCGWTSLVLL